MEVPEPVPTFGPASVSEGDDLQHECPGATIYMVHGLMGPELDDPVCRVKNDHSSTNTNHRTLFYSPSEIAGEKSFESALEKQARIILEQIHDERNKHERFFTFWAHDIGGTILKLALVIAAQEDNYRYIVDRTHLVVFLGTPHRGSHKQSLDSVIFEIIDSCSNVLVGRWASRLINTLSRQHEDIGKRFNHISHKFGIVNYYQASTSVPSYEVVVPEDCATMGLETEVRIGRDLPHKHLPSFMSEEEAVLLQNHDLSTKFALWDSFRKFMCLISSCASQQNASKIEPNTPVLSHATFKSWLSSEDIASRYLALNTRGIPDMTDILRSAAAAVQEHQKTLWVKYPALCFPEANRLNIYASLILQVLAQKPQSFMSIWHLVPTVMDSIKSVDQVWAERTLWGCLRTLIHTPTRTPTYGFVYLGSATSAHVLHMLDVALQETDSNFRLVLAQREEQYPQCERLKPLVVDLEPNGSAWDTTEGRAAGGFTSIEDRLRAFTLEDPGLEQWTLFGLIWIAYAFRPLTVEELDLILSLESDRLGISSHGSYARLIQLLPGIVECKLGRIVLLGSYPEAQKIVARLMKPPLASDASPHIRIARTSLTFLRTHASNNANETATQEKEWGISRVPVSHRGFTEYAARYWLAHYRLAAVDNIESEDAFSHFVADERNLINWASVLNHFSQLEPSKTTNTDSIVETVGKYLNLKSFKSSEVLYDIAMRSSQLPSSGRLLIYAAEHGDEELLNSLYKNIQSIDQEALITAAATLRGALHDEAIEFITALPESDQTILSRIELNARVMGNSEASIKILPKLLDTMPESVQNEWFADALRVAVENQDNEAVTRLLERQDLVQHICNDKGSRWTILHFAAHVGSLPIMSQLLNAGLRNIIDTPSPKGQSPLIIASSRGFLGITRLLLSEGASVDLVDYSGKTALHYASQYGFFETAKELLSNASDVLATDAEGDYPLHLAIRNRKTQVAELLVDAFPFIPRNMQPAVDSSLALDAHSPVYETDVEYDINVETPLDNSNYHLDDPGVDISIDDESGMESDETNAAPLDHLNLMGKTVLIEAAEQNLPSVVKHLLERNADPNVRGDLSRRAIHRAVSMRALEVVQSLVTAAPDLTIRDDYWYTPLNICCYQGHLGTAVKLLESGADIEFLLDDKWGGIPLSAACTAGNLSLVRALFHKYDEREWGRSLVAAARYGQYDIAVYLLDMGCPVHIDALVGAVEYSQPKIVHLLLLRGAEAAGTCSGGGRVIHKAALAGSLEVVKLLSDAGAGLNEEDTLRDSPLGIAIHAKHPEIVDFLLQRGARMALPRRRWLDHKSLLDFSWEVSSEQVTKVLLGFYKQGKQDPRFAPIYVLKKIIDKNDEKLLDLALDTWYGSDKTGYLSDTGKAIHYAFESKTFRLLRKLLEHPLGKSAINYEVPGEGTLLHAAAYAGAEEVVQLLLNEGADANIISGRFGTALNAACAAAKSDVAKFLVRHMSVEALCSNTGIYGSAVQSAIVGFQHEPGNDIIAFLKFLRGKGVSPEIVRGTYTTPLHASLSLSLSVPNEVVYWLIKNAPYSLICLDWPGRLPLHLAILKGEWHLISEIMNSRRELWISQLSWRDTQGLSGLHYAAMSRSSVPLTNIIKLDWQENEINAKDIDGWTPLHWACRQSSPDNVKILKEKNADMTARTNKGWTPRQIAILHDNTSDEYLGMLPETAEEGPDLPEGPLHTLEKAQVHER
ncbi:ankyrin repeat-containing domain protein [Nemania abortiva]|nr:ankyrin repeat-containing domain protein [Nemania abortiva]